MHQRFIAPRAYVQGAGALGDAGAELAALDAERCYLLGGETALDVAGDPLRAGVAAADAEVVDVAAGVEACTRATIEGHADAVRAADADLVVGVGGGVAQDVATAVAGRTGTGQVSVPTIASTDAPCSTVAVVYDEAGNFREVELRDRNPDLVLVDTAVVADAPARFLAAGMGDALATTFEAAAVAATGTETVAGGRSSAAARALAAEAFERVAADGPEALAAVERGAVTPAVERIVEANVLLSGVGFESGGTAGAHAVQKALTNVGVRKPHGVLVAVGTVVELLVRDADRATRDRVLDACFAVGLDRTLAELDAADADLDRVGELALELGFAGEPVDPDAARVADALRTVDELVRRRRD